MVDPGHPSTGPLGIEAGVAEPHGLLLLMIGNPRVIDRPTRLLWAAHNLERVADRLQTICERVVFVATGQMREFSRGPLAVD